MAIGDQNVVDENFWTNMGAERVYGALQKMQESAERLQKAIVWIFGVYSTITFGAIIWSKKEDWNVWAIVIFGLSFIFLIISYYLSTIATFSEPSAVNINAPEDVKAAYELSIAKFYERFHYALTLCSLGVIFYCIALMIQFTSPLINSVAEKPVSLTSPTDSLELNVKPQYPAKKLAIYIHSKKRSWVAIDLTYDSLINKKQRTLQVSSLIGNKSGLKPLPTLVYVDSSGNAQLEVQYREHEHMTLQVARTDSTNGSQSYKQHIIKHKLN